MSLKGKNDLGVPMSLRRSSEKKGKNFMRDVFPSQGGKQV
jgi:hypothetical protein